MTDWLRCPVRNCGAPMSREPSRLCCTGGHSFDFARSGYVNLLQPQDRRSKTPGDSPAAVAARRRLVDRGIEARLLAGLAAFAATVQADRPGKLLDAGCGEGSVTMALSVATGLEPVGMDISATAVDKAARRYPYATWIVANADRELPVADGSFSIVASVVARRNPAEFARVLEPGGFCIVVVPGPDDLAELRLALLGASKGRDRGDAVESEFGDNWELIGRSAIRDRAHLDRQAIEDFLASTYRGARASERGRAADLDSLDVTLHRDALAFRRIT